MKVPYKSLAGSLAAISVFASSVAAFAQSSTPSGIPGAGFADRTDRPVPTQQCMQAMLDMENVHFLHFDERIADEKTRMQARIDGLKAIALLSDDTARADALKAMHDQKKDMAPPAPPADIVASMDAVKAACGDVMMFGGGHHRGPMGREGMMGGPGMMKGGFGGHGRRGHGPMKRMDADGDFDDDVEAPDTAPSSAQ